VSTYMSKELVILNYCASESEAWLVTGRPTVYCSACGLLIAVHSLPESATARWPVGDSPTMMMCASGGVAGNSSDLVWHVASDIPTYSCRIHSFIHSYSFISLYDTPQQTRGSRAARRVGYIKKLRRNHDRIKTKCRPM